MKLLEVLKMEEGCRKSLILKEGEVEGRQLLQTADLVRQGPKATRSNPEILKVGQLEEGGWELVNVFTPEAQLA